MEIYSIDFPFSKKISCFVVNRQFCPGETKTPGKEAKEASNLENSFINRKLIKFGTEPSSPFSNLRRFSELDGASVVFKEMVTLTGRRDRAIKWL